MQAPGRSIAVIGAGFSGALLAVHLLRRCRSGDRIYLVERNQKFGRGLAYSTGNPGHLLNVRAGNMSAFLSEPLHFLNWLERQPEEALEGIERPLGPNTFVPRRLYGAYIQDLLGSEIWAEGRGRNLYLVADEAVALERDPDGLVLEVSGGRRFPVDRAVLALGNFPPEENRPNYYGDPWHPDAVADLDRRAPVLVIGTGLTMVDTVIALHGARHEGPIVAVSRRGLLPQPHRETRAWPGLPVPDLGSLSLLTLMRMIRQQVALAEAAGIDWRAVVDALRPSAQTLWQALPLAEKRRFLRHLRPWWDVHRHRIAPPVASIIDRLVESGQLRILRGRLLALDPEDDGFRADVAGRDGAVERLRVQRVINCSGPACDYGRSTQPLIRNLLDQGLARPDPLHLGLDAAPNGALIDRAGMPSRRLFALGPVTRGTLWEITSVPDIRTQCVQVANALLPVPIDDLFVGG